MKRIIFLSTAAVLLCGVLIGLRYGGTAPADNPAPAAPDTGQALPETTAPPKSFDEATQLRISDGGQVTTISLGQYLLGVVSSEMPLSFPEEALKAQAVASRTYVLYQMEHGRHSGFDVCSDSTCCQAWQSEQALAQRHGADWPQYRELAQRAVSETDGQVLTYDGALIDATFFACSGGRTESSLAVWGGDLPYLQPVDSPGEEAASCYLGEVAVPQAEFCSILQQADPEVAFGPTPAGWFGMMTETTGGGVAALVIGGRSFTGTQLRQLFGLNSTNFTVAVTEDSIVFETLGKGHRVGLSQYGAQAMAQAGSDWQQILLHYYTGVQIDNRNDP